jgi:cytochrome c-type biogenesis protein CcmE
MTPRQRRLAFVSGGLMAIAAASAFVLNAFQSNVAFFVSPSDIAREPDRVHERFRLGGLVKRGTLSTSPDGRTVTFDVTDNVTTVRVTYRGILPDLFREGSGVVAQGRLGDDRMFHADEVLAKHDEKYAPPEVKRALEQAGAAPTGRTTVATTGPNGEAAR